MTPAVDADTGTLFIVVGNPSPDLDGEIRPGDNLYTESMVALDVKSGTYKWHCQFVPHDVWDLDAVSPAVLFEIGSQKVVGHAGKTGWYYILDRATGKLVRRSDAFVAQENTFAQPTPTRPASGCSPGRTAARSGRQRLTAPTPRWPTCWRSTSRCGTSRTRRPTHQGKLWLGSAFVAIPGEEQWGTLSGIDVNTGKIAWQNKLPDPLIGGPVVTAGGILFSGGDGTGNFYAFDTKTAKELWRFQCGAGVNAAPISFEVDGEQFIALAAGGNFQLNFKYGELLFVFGLPKK